MCAPPFGSVLVSKAKSRGVRTALRYAPIPRQSRRANAMPAAPSRSRRVYHEPQRLYRCGLHTVNALLQGPVYSAADFDLMADVLAPASGVLPRVSHPHRSVLRLGEYDVNVIVLSLQKAAMDVRWLNKARLATKQGKMDLAEQLTHVDDSSPLVGFLVNVPVTRFPAWLTRLFADGRHWLAVTRVGPDWYLIDSSQAQPVRLEDASAAADYLVSVLTGDGHVLCVERSR